MPPFDRAMVTLFLFYNGQIIFSNLRAFYFILFFAIFIQEVDGVSSSLDVWVTTIIYVILLSELVLDKAGAELVGVELFLSEMFLLLP